MNNHFDEQMFNLWLISLYHCWFAGTNNNQLATRLLLLNIYAVGFWFLTELHFNERNASNVTTSSMNRCCPFGFTWYSRLFWKLNVNGYSNEFWLGPLSVFSFQLTSTFEPKQFWFLTNNDKCPTIYVIFQDPLNDFVERMN